MVQDRRTDIFKRMEDDHEDTLYGDVRQFNIAWDGFIDAIVVALKPITDMIKSLTKNR